MMSIYKINNYICESSAARSSVGSILKREVAFGPNTWSKSGARREKTSAMLFFQSVFGQDAF
jgi:hypothetical protein